MELSKPIPSRLIIAAHSYNCSYVGQAQTFFSYPQIGHRPKAYPNQSHATGNIIHADAPLTSVNRQSASTVQYSTVHDERIGAIYGPDN